MGLILDDNLPVGSTAKFVMYGTALGLAVDLAVYPAELLKTRLQVSRQVRGCFGENWKFGCNSVFGRERVPSFKIRLL
jgi:hypothetical protein